MTELEAVEIGKAISAGQFSSLLNDTIFLFAPLQTSVSTKVDMTKMTVHAYLARLLS